MIPVPSGVRVWIATGHTDMRRGMNSLALLVQEAFKRDPHAGDLYVFRGKRGKHIKILWHDGLGMSLYAKRLERGQFIWPSAAAGVVSISMPQLVFRVQCTLRAGSEAGTNHGSWMLGPRETQAIRACRYRLEGAQQEAVHDLANRVRGGQEVRRHLRAGTLDQRLVTRSALSRAPQGRCAAGE